MLALLDLSAAFDTVDHEILLDRLHQAFGIRGSALEWIESFVADRVQTVVFAGEKSVESRVLCGIPHGSVLGPILFLLCAEVTPIAERNNINGHSYADDTQLYIHCDVTECATASASLSFCIEELDSWMTSNRLKLNADKAQFIWTGSRQQVAKMNIAAIVLRDIRSFQNAASSAWAYLLTPT